MKFWLSEWQHKGAPFVRALLDAGHTIDESDPDFVLFDHDIAIDRIGYRPALRPFVKRGIPIFLYPHGAHPITLWDGVYPHCPNVTVNFVPAYGHQEVMRRYGYPITTIAVGFPFCEILPFKPTDPELVVFAPIHPLRSGYVQPEDEEINKRTMKKLLATGLPVLVRFIGELEQGGLKHEPGVEYLQAEPDGSTREIDKASLVVAAGTYLYMAVARGVPAISIRERQRPFWGRKRRKYAAHWADYADYMGYPFDEADHESLRKVITLVTSWEDDGLKIWRERFIGQQFDHERFARLIHFFMGKKKQ